jgi:hypothetical protein
MISSMYCTQQTQPWYLDHFYHIGDGCKNSNASPVGYPATVRALGVVKIALPRFWPCRAAVCKDTLHLNTVLALQLSS